MWGYLIILEGIILGYFIYVGVFYYLGGYYFGVFYLCGGILLSWGYFVIWGGFYSVLRVFCRGCFINLGGHLMILGDVFHLAASRAGFGVLAASLPSPTRPGGIADAPSGNEKFQEL